MQNCPEREASAIARANAMLTKSAFQAFFTALLDAPLVPPLKITCVWIIEFVLPPTVCMSYDWMMQPHLLAHLTELEHNHHVYILIR
jgi:hypothetical protein